VNGLLDGLDKARVTKLVNEKLENETLRLAEAVGKADDLGEFFNTADTVKQRMDRFLKHDAARLTPEQDAAINPLRAAVGKLRDALQNPEVFGEEAAAFQARTNRAQNAFFAARDGLRSQWSKKVATSVDEQTGKVIADKHFEADPKKARTAIKQFARNDPGGDAAKRALEHYQQAYKDLLEEMRVSTYEPLGNRNVDIGKVGEDLGAIADSRDKAVSSAKEAYDKNVKNHMSWFHVPGIPGVLAEGIQNNTGTMLGMMGAHALGIPVPLLGAAAGLVMARNIARGAKSEVVAGLAKAAAKTTHAISLKLDAALSTAGRKGTNAAAPAIAALMEYGRGAKGESRLDAYRRRLAEIDQVQKDPEHQLAQLEAATKGIQPHAPGTAGVIQQSLLAREKYLSDHAPRSPLPPDPLGQKQTPYHPTPSELAKFERIHRAVTQPLSLADDLRHGTVTPEAVDAVRSTSPALYGEMSRQLLQKLADNQHPLDYGQRMQISIFLGRPVAYSQQLTPPAAPAQPQGGGQMTLRNGSAMTHLSGANRSATKYGGEPD
jgi:hypothetical protein